MNTRKQAILLLVVVSLMIWVSAAQADDIPVANGSFEVLPAGAVQTSCGAGCWWTYTPTVPGWTGDNWVGGQFQPGVYFNYVPDGSTIIWSTSGALLQTVGTVVPGVTYELQVDVGKRADTQPNMAFPQLMIGGTSYAATGAAPPYGEWSTWSVSYLGTTADAGQPITIRLGALGAQGTFDNVRFGDDQVRLAAPTGTPEPASLLLVAVGLVGGAIRKLSK